MRAVVPLVPSRRPAEWVTEAVPAREVAEASATAAKAAARAKRRIFIMGLRAAGPQGLGKRLFLEGGAPVPAQNSRSRAGVETWGRLSLEDPGSKAREP